VPVMQIAPLKLFTCSPEDDVHCALKTIRRQQVRRLPVVDRNGVLKGILCMDDIVTIARPYGGKHEVSFDDVIETYRAICERRSPGPVRTAVGAGLRLA